MWALAGTVVLLLAFRGLLSIIFDGPGWVW